jgi:hypothetical protein
MPVRAPLVAAALLALVACAPAAAPRATATPPAAATTAILSADDRVRIAETYRLADAIADSLWSGWRDAPFAILLVTPEREILVRHPRPSADFTRAGYDALLASDVLVRPRTLAPNLLATFPAVSGVPTIVVGQPRATGKSSTEWVLTLLHEHFHQLQQSRPGYFAQVEGLGLTRGDRTGMWMLNYPYPYDSGAVQQRYAAFAARLDSALAVAGPDVRRSHWLAALVARAALRAAVTSDDDRYLAFQMWQEGVARYTELRAARLAARTYAPSAAFRALPDYAPFDTVADRIERTIRDGLHAPLARDRRVAFYPLGAAFAMLLDWSAPDWRKAYFEKPFALDDHAQ